MKTSIASSLIECQGCLLYFYNMTIQQVCLVPENQIIDCSYICTHAINDRYYHLIMDMDGLLANGIESVFDSDI